MVFSDVPFNNQASSVICVYQLNIIDYIFKNSKLKGQGYNFYAAETTDSTWKPPLDTDFSNLPFRPGTCPSIDTQNQFELQEFLLDYTLLNSTIPSVQVYPAPIPSVGRNYLNQSEPPIMLLDGIYVTEMVVQENVCGQTVFFLGTVDGKVYKAYVYGLNTATPETRIFEAIDLATGAADDDHEVLSMEVQINPDNDANTVDAAIFVGTTSSLHRFPVHHCFDYSTYGECILAQDPYCSWSGTACTASCNGLKCLDPDPFSCIPGNWPSLELFNPTQDDDFVATYDRIVYALNTAGSALETESNVQIDMWVQSEKTAVWGETTFVCTCGCPPVDYKETTGIRSSSDFKAYLLGFYIFDLTACTANVGITFTFKTNSNTLSETVIVMINEDACCSPACMNGGICVTNNTCICFNGFTGNQCEIHVITTTTVETTIETPDVLCKEILNTARSGLSWSTTPVNETAHSNERCNVTTMHRGKSLASRKCLPGTRINGIWGTPVLNDCGSFDEFDVDDLENITVVESNVVEVAMALTDVTEDLRAGDVTVEDISNIADVIVDIVDVKSNDSQIITSVVEVSSDLVSATTNNADIREKSQAEFLKILQALEDQLIRSISLGHNTTSVNEGNVAFTTMAVETKQASTLGFSFTVQQNSGDGTFRPGDITSGYQNVPQGADQTRSSLLLPPSLFKSFGNGSVGIGFLVHNSDTMFPTELGDRMVSSDIISINVEGFGEMQTLPDPVKMQFQAPGNDPTCVFWEFATNSWSEDGCSYSGRASNGHIICECTHLTNFAVIVAPKDNKKPVISNTPSSNITRNTDPGVPNARVTWSQPKASDDSGFVTLESNFEPGDSFPIGLTEVIYEAIDPSGNRVTFGFTITVKDTEDPILECPDVEEQFVVTDQIEVEVFWHEPTYNDNSGLPGDSNSTGTSPSVFDIGFYNVTYFAWDPYGNTASCIISIRVTAACPENSTAVNSLKLLWLQTPASNKEVDSFQRCDVRTENRGRGIATRVCMRDETRGAVWRNPDYFGCGEKDNFTLADLPETPVIDSNVENVAEALNNVTQQQSDKEVELTTDDVQDIAETFRNIVDVGSVTPEVTMTVIEIANNLVELTEQTETSQAEDSSAEYYADILLAIEQQVNRSTASGQNLTTVEPNIAVIITTVMPNQPTGFSFAVLDSNREEFREENIQTYNDPADIPEERRTAVVLPSAIFNTTVNDTIGVSFVVHNSDVLFPTNSTNQTVGSDIVSAIVTGVEYVNNLPEPIVLEFTVSGKNADCVFWDFEISDWSQDGCRLFEVLNGNRAICHCDHLTNFAVLVDATFDKGHIILDVVSKIGCGVSMLALLITLVIFIGFRRLRIGTNAIPRQILINLCLALFFLYFVFLVGIEQTSHRNGCICVAFLLQYLTLASLMWMGVEGFNLYLIVIRVFDAMPERFVLKAAIIAWGLPLVISAISLAAGFSNYYHLEYCFVGTGPPLFFGIVLPIAVILFFNFVMFVWMSYSLCKTNLGGNAGDKSMTKMNIQRLQNAFSMSILMGLTWVFGFFAIDGAQFVFSLIFCLCNSFQGLVLFLVFCIRQEDVRRTLRPYIQRFCCKFFSNSNAPSQGFQTASTGVSSGDSKSPYRDVDFSASAPLANSPYNDMDFSATMPMSHLSEDNPTYVTTGDAMGHNTVSVEMNLGKLSPDTKLTLDAADADTEDQAGEGSETQKSGDGTTGLKDNELPENDGIAGQKDNELPEDEGMTEQKVNELPEDEVITGQKNDELPKEKDETVTVLMDNGQLDESKDIEEEEEGGEGLQETEGKEQNSLLKTPSVGESEA